MYYKELEALLRGCGYTPHFVEGDDPDTMHLACADEHGTDCEEITNWMWPL